MNLSHNHFGGKEHSHNSIGIDDGVGLKAIVCAACKNTRIIALDLRWNHLAVETARTLSDIAKIRNISLCGGFNPGQVNAHFYYRNMCGDELITASDAILIASDLATKKFTSVCGAID